MHEYLSETDFRALIDEVFAPFLSEIGFELSEYKTTNIWRFAEFAGQGLAVEVMYEFPMHYADVRLQTKSDIWRPHVHPATTLTISLLNEQYREAIGADELAENERYFSEFDSVCPEAKRLFAMAKRLRVVLPRWMHDNRVRYTDPA